MGRGLVTEPSSKASVLLQEDADLGCSRGLECTICYDAPNNPVVTFCGHLFCYDCLHAWVKLHAQKKQCPVCKSKISKVVKILGQDGGSAPQHIDVDDSTVKSHEETHTGTPQERPGGLQSTAQSSNLRTEDRFANEAMSPVSLTSTDPELNNRDRPLPFRTQSHTAQLVSASAPALSPAMSPEFTSASASSSPQTASAQASTAAGGHSRTSRLRERRVVKTVTRWLHDRTWVHAH